MLSVMSGSYCWDWRRDETSFFWILLLTLTFQSISISVVVSLCQLYLDDDDLLCIIGTFNKKNSIIFCLYSLALVVSSVLEWEFAWKWWRFDPNEARWKNKVKPLKRSSLFCLKLPWLYQYQTIINLIDTNKDTPRARFKDSKEIYAFLQRFRSSL